MPPRLLINVPANSLFKSAFKSFFGLPAKLSLKLRRINCVTSVMARPLLDERNQLSPRTGSARFDMIKQVTNTFNHQQIGSFVAATNIVGVANLTMLQHKGQRFGMILHVKPVSHVLSVSINGQRFILETPCDDTGNQLFRKVIRAVVVRAIRHHRRQIVSLTPSSN